MVIYSSVAYEFIKREDVAPGSEKVENPASNGDFSVLSGNVIKMY
jgi:hypothetical protein